MINALRGKAMGRRFRIAVLLAGMVPVSSGCWMTAPFLPSPNAPPVALPSGPRLVPAVDVAAVTTELPAPAPPAAENHQYVQLSSENCREIACQYAPAARAIIAAAQDQDAICFEDSARGASARLRVITAKHLSDQIRNESAGAALDLYYRLLEAELLSDILLTSITEVDEVVRSGETLSSKGFRESPEFFQLRQQQIELRADYTRLRHGVQRINGELKLLLGQSETPALLMPFDGVRVEAEDVHPEAAVQIALQSRPDLLLIRDLMAGLDRRTITAVRSAIVGLVPTLNVITKPGRLFAPGLLAAFPNLLQDEVESTHRQLQAMLQQREQEVSKDVRAAIDEWKSQQQLVAVMKRRLQFEEERRDVLATRRKAGAAVETEYRQARLAVLKTEADLIREVIKWKQADIKARQAMGLLCCVSGPLIDAHKPAKRAR